MSVAYARAVYRSELSHRLKSLAAYIGLAVLDDIAVAKRKEKNPECADRPRLFWSSASLVAADLGLQPQAVYLGFKELLAKKILTIVQPGGGRKRFGKRVAGVATTYEFHPDALTPRPPKSRKEAARATVRPTTEIVGFTTRPSTETVGFTAATLTEYVGLYRNKELSGKKDLQEACRPSDVAVAPPTDAALLAVVQSEKPTNAEQKAPAIKRCLHAYRVAYLRRFGIKPQITPGKDAKLVRQMLATWGEATVLDVIQDFFTTTDARVQQAGFTVGSLFHNAQRLILHARQPVADIRTLENLDAAARAMRPRRSIRVVEPQQEQEPR